MSRSPRPSPWSRLFLLLLLGAGLAACATRPDPSDPEAVAEFREANDPLEPLNRASYFVNDGIDTLLLRPAAEAYRIFVPPEVRVGVRNVLGNVRTPVVLLNDVLQGDSYGAAETLGRFLLNTTLGVGGIFDVAKDLGLPGHANDFGQTLARWGTGEGPYLFVPVLGPSNPRDLAGAGADLATNPLNYVGGEFWSGLNTGRTVASGLDTREGLIDPLDAVRRESLDPYATIRSAYRQRRAAEVARTSGASQAARGTGFGAGTGGPGQNR
ncbi:MlaA family lipoprotein [Falsiroseomonas sp. HW251]|uniref:MlaA family lipoprotein n=1 Tax=Falsiroseomonas sp. HW251 TaxID=3390998 RepID=UPI003D31AC1C